MCATAAGRSLIPCVAELGGNAPVLVFADADLAQAVNGVAFGSACLTGKSHLGGSPKRERDVSTSGSHGRAGVGINGRMTGGIGLSGIQAAARFFSVITGKAGLRSIGLQPNRKWD